MDDDKEVKKAFDVDGRIHVAIEPGLAAEVSDIILNSNTPNKAVLAFGHNLRNTVNVRRRPR